MGLGACGRFRPSRASAPVGLSSAQASLGRDVTDGTLLRRLVGRIGSDQPRGGRRPGHSEAAPLPTSPGGGEPPPEEVWRP
jgi:hypothetical protein